MSNYFEYNKNTNVYKFHLDNDEKIDYINEDKCEINVISTNQLKLDPINIIESFQEKLKTIFEKIVGKNTVICEFCDNINLDFKLYSSQSNCKILGNVFGEESLDEDFEYKLKIELQIHNDRVTHIINQITIYCLKNNNQCDCLSTFNEKKFIKQLKYAIRVID